MPRYILEITKKYQKNPVHIRISHKELTVPGIEQFYIEAREPARLDVLSRVIDNGSINLSLAFCNTKRKAAELADSLKTRGYLAEALHGDLRQSDRDHVMARFRNGEIEILVATDVAARGIDVENIDAVFNYDMPNDDEYYVHRIGRTGRAGRAGLAYTFVSGREIYKIRELEKFTRSAIRRISPPSELDIEEGRMSVLIRKVEDTLNEGKYARFSSTVEKALDQINERNEEAADYTTLDIAAALFKMLSAQSAKPRAAVMQSKAPAIAIKRNERSFRKAPWVNK
jgi:ATP-dependent RNA helicase DeaD